MSTLQFPQPDRGERRGLALLLAGGVHAVLLLLLVFGLQWQVKRDEPVAVELWAALPKPSQPKIEPAKPEPKPVPKVQPKPRPEPEPEPVEVKKPDIALKQDKPKPAPKPEPEPPKAKEKPQPKPKEQAEPKPEPKPEVKPKPVNRAAELAKLADEFSSSVKPAPVVKPGPTAAEAAAGKAKANYGDTIRSRIERNVIWSADKVVGSKAVFEVTLLPSMEVLKVEKIGSSGNSSYDDAAERAIWKTSPFPPRPDELPFNEVRKLTLRLSPPQ